MRYVFNVIASVGRKIQKSYRSTVFFNVIAALLSIFSLYNVELIVNMRLCFCCFSGFHFIKEDHLR